MASTTPTTTTTFAQSTQHDWERPAFWQSLCPHLTIDSDTPLPSINDVDEIVKSVPHVQARRELQTRGYTLMDHIMFSSSELQDVRQGIALLHAAGFPASFILLFDVTWNMATVARRLFQSTCLESNRFQYDILAWHITHQGFSPHRDRQPVDAAASFDGLDAKFVTQWIALTPATTQNSCLYVIPATQDPGYRHGDDDKNNDDDENDDKADPLQRALPNKHAYQHICALPRNIPGQSLLFTHRLIHWGAARDPHTTQEPRMALSFTCADPSFEKPYLRKHDEYFTDTQRPPFRIRLLLVAAQLLIYYQRFDLPLSVLRICNEIVTAHQDELDPEYCSKVCMEFVKAMQEAAQETNKNNHDKVEDSNNNASDDEEAVLNAMLNAEEGGYGDDFVDDYDEDVGPEEEEDNDDGGGDKDDDEEEEDDDDDDENEDDEAPDPKRAKTVQTS